jgi:hypothetical protein
MVRTDPGSTRNVRASISPQVIALSTEVEGAGFSTVGWRRCMVVVTTGTVGASADGTLTIEMSATDVDAAYEANPIAGASITVTATDDDTIFWGVIDLEQQPEFIRAVYNSGAGGTTAISASFVLSSPKDGSVDMTSANDATFSV